MPDGKIPWKILCVFALQHGRKVTWGHSHNFMIHFKQLLLLFYYFLKIITSPKCEAHVITFHFWILFCTISAGHTKALTFPVPWKQLVKIRNQNVKISLYYKSQRYCVAYGFYTQNCLRFMCAGNKRILKTAIVWKKDQKKKKKLLWLLVTCSLFPSN